ncbi:MAG: T9SS type A sorting domain-containing protein [Bacteroidales bacterium]|nr:T9SS type A sorting domain-containing protein [Candidatus Colimorpha pelethequi]
MKRILSLLLLLAATMFTTALHAQGHFDWVKSYSGPRVNGIDVTEIISSVHDKDGNIYILGHFAPGANLDGTELLPVAGSNTYCTLIAKLSPSGEMLWHKSLYASGTYWYAHDIRNIGDTSIMVMTSFSQAASSYYFLDTLLTAADSLLMTTDSISNYAANVFITIDSAGNLEDHHFLQMAWVDTSGATIRSRNDNKIATSALSNEMFNVDSQGNIYVCRAAYDFAFNSNNEELSVANGGIGMCRILIDGVRSLYFQPSYRSDYRNQQILKFSPRFKDLISAQYVFDSLCIPEEAYTYINVTSFERDDDDNFYLLLGGAYYPDTMRIANSNSLMCLSDSSMVANNACMISYTPSLVATNVVQLSCTPGTVVNTPSVNYYFHGTAIDDSTKSLYLLGSVQKDSYNLEDTTCHIKYRNDTLDLGRNLFWLHLNPQTGELLSYGKSRSTYLTKLKISSSSIPAQASLAVKSNRIFSQVCYQGNISWRDTAINRSIIDWGIGVMCWDSNGHEIQFIDYNANSSENKPQRVHLVDSNLYLTGVVNSGADFGNHHVNSTGHNQAYIVCYTDTAFMTPYVYKDTTGNGGGNGGNGGDTNDVRIVMAEDGNAFVAYPNPFRQRVNVEYSGQQPITAAYLTDIMGRTEQVELSATGNGRYTLDLTARPQAAYLLTLVTQAGHRHTVGLLKQSEVFGR